MEKALSMKALYEEKFNPESIIKKLQLLSKQVNSFKSVNVEFSNVCKEMEKAYEDYRHHFERFEMVIDVDYIDYYTYMIKADEAKIKGLYKRACSIAEQ